MHESTEIEVKALVTEKEFTLLCSHFKLDSNDFFTQTNHYFDTPNQSIVQSKSSLRVREVNHKFILTLKRKIDKEIIEYEQEISEEEFSLLKSKQKDFNDYYQELFHYMLVKGEEIEYIGNLTTIRASIKYEQGELFFDHNYYQQTNDYEIEYETYNYEYGYEIVSSLFKKLEINFIVNDIPKRARAVAKRP